MIVGPSLLNQLVVSHELITPNYSGPITKDSIDLRIESIFKHSGKAILTLEERDIGKFEEIEMVECIWTLSPNTTYIGMTAEEVALAALSGRYRNGPQHNVPCRLPRINRLYRSGIPRAHLF